MTPENVTLKSLVVKITTDILNPIIILLFVLATIIFVWGIVRYNFGTQGDPKQIDTAKRVLLWGIIGMFVMASAWGIVNLLCDFFGTCIS
jgi:hypothetical protein